MEVASLAATLSPHGLQFPSSPISRKVEIVLTAILSLICILAIAPAAFAGTVTITSPTDGATLGAPLDVHATYAASATAKYMKLWVDHNPSTVQSNTNVFDQQLSLSDGAHTITVQALDSSDGKIYADTANITVSSGSGGSHTVTITSPTNGATVNSPLDVHATYSASATAKYMKLWLDHKASTVESNTNVFDQQVSLSNGAHVVTVQALDSANGQIYADTANITVGGSGGSHTVTITSPTNGATVNSPVDVHATYSASATAKYMKLWLDHKASTVESNTNVFDQQVSLSNGPHVVTVQALDSVNGQIYANTANITVGGTTATVTVSPASVSLNAGATQQFTATDSAGLGVTWSATGGTITSSGLYTAGPTAGTFAVTATDSSNNKGSASVTIQNSIPTVTVQSPTDGSTVSSPVSIHATYNETANYMKLWIDHQPETVQQKTNVFDTSVDLAAGTHLIEVQAQDASSGVVYTSSGINITVTSGGTVLNYTTWKNDNARTGQQRNETRLTPANVNSSQFGVLFSDSVDGSVYAQPLYLANQMMADGVRNVVFVATEHDSVYAFDADKGGSPLWKTSLMPAGATTVPQSLVHSTIFPEIGITSTPVIDPDTGTLYVVGETLENSNVVFRLHALNVITGKEQGGSPVVIDTDGWQPLEQMQRPGLLLANGNVYIGFGSHGDTQPYHGWIFAYSAQSLAQVGVWNATPTATEGSIWMAGSGLAADPIGNVYAMTANGHWDGIANFSDSFVKLMPNLSMLLGSFSPSNQSFLAAHDLDLGAGGVLLVPDQSGSHPHLIIGCGKYPSLFILDRDDMSLLQEVDDAVGTGDPGTGVRCFLTPAYWQQNIYFTANKDVIKMFTLNASTGQLSTTPSSQGTYVFGFPGAQPAVSSNGSSNGIVWAVEYSKTDAALHAFDATDVSKELYRSGSLGAGAKWAVPTVINGKVYVGTGSKLFVFGPTQ
ncbi:MAG TPA: hypothetical protein VJ731_04930 [Terriglobales bacterium]|nr:hypothetical protein [Terriglobales bacterium]